MCNLLKIKHVGESDELPCPMTLYNFTHGQSSPPDILIKLFESLQSDDGANHGLAPVAVVTSSVARTTF